MEARASQLQDHKRGGSMKKEDPLKKEEKKLFDTYSMGMSYDVKIKHLEKMIEVFKKIQENERATIHTQKAKSGVSKKR